MTKYHEQLALNIHPIRLVFAILIKRELRSLAFQCAHTDESELRADGDDAHADLSLCWAQMSYCFVSAWLIY